MKIKFLNPNEKFSLAMKDFSALHKALLGD